MIFIFVASIFIFDQLTKLLICHNLFPHQTVPLIKGILHLTLVHNRGAAFGIFKNQVPLFIVASLIAITLIVVQLKKDRRASFSAYTLSLSLILAGALGNLTDRVFFGYVIDFIDFRIWPVFNIADSAITVGAILLTFAVFKKPETADK
jgi:signal peptidase II